MTEKIYKKRIKEKNKKIKQLEYRLAYCVLTMAEKKAKDLSTQYINQAERAASLSKEAAAIHCRQMIIIHKENRELKQRVIFLEARNVSK